MLSNHFLKGLASNVGLQFPYMARYEQLGRDQLMIIGLLCTLTTCGHENDPSSVAIIDCGLKLRKSAF